MCLPAYKKWKRKFDQRPKKRKRLESSLIKKENKSFTNKYLKETVYDIHLVKETTLTFEKKPLVLALRYLD